MAELKIVEVEARDGDGLAVFSLSGEIDLKTVEELRETLAFHAESGTRHFILDLAETRYVNSSALAVLTKFARVFSEKGGGILMTRVNARVKMPFEMLGLLRFFEFFDSVEDARASLRAGS